MTTPTSNCTGDPAEKYAELYILGTLPEFESERFENHYFDCDVCLAQVQTLQAMAQALGQDRRLQESVQTARKATILTWPVRPAFIGAIAAMLLIAFAGYKALAPVPSHPTTTTASTPPRPDATIQPTQPTADPHPTVPTPSAPALPELADLTLPPFGSAALRGDGQDIHFEQGMKAYGAGDCRTALLELAQVPPDSGHATGAQFYSGACQMHTGNLAAAATHLRPIANAGDSPQQEAALYYLAQIDLARNDAASARRDLAQTIKLHGDFETRARGELQAMPARPAPR
jgi:TolA-binding protein